MSTSAAAASPHESHTHCWSSAEAHLRLASCAASDVADRLPGIFEDHDLVGPEDDALQEMARLMRQNGLVAVGLVQPHSRDLSTSNSQPGEDGSKPCSISQRAASRLRNDHHARITSRST